MAMFSNETYFRPRFGKPRAKKRGLSGSKKIVYLHRFFVQFEDRTPASKDVQKAIVDLWGDILKVLQNKDPDLALVKGVDDKIIATL